MPQATWCSSIGVQTCGKAPMTPLVLPLCPDVPQATPENLVQFHRGSDVRLSPDDVIFSVINIDYAAKGKNPMDKVLFFDDLGEE